MRRVLHVIDTTGPGGAETVFVELAARTRAAGFESIALIRGEGWVFDRLKEKQVETHILDTSGSFDSRYLRGLVRLLRKRNVAIVQSHLLGSNVYCAIAGLIARRPVVATFHGTVDVAARERYLKLKIALMNAGVSQYVTVSRSLERDIARYGVKPTTVLYNGIDAGRYVGGVTQELRSRLALKADDILVGTLGNIRPAKAYDVLIKAAQIACSRHQSIHFVIAGDDTNSEALSLKRLTETLGISGRVHFIGFQKDASKYLQQLDVFALSSSSEGFSIATIEAQASGLPVVVTRCGGPEEIVEHGVNGWLVQMGAPVELAAALVELANDSKLRCHLGRAGRESVAQRFSIDVMVSGYAAIYSRLLGG